MRRGQTIVEILVAVAVATVGLLALIQVATRSVSNTSYAKRQTIATGYANEGMEWVKRQKDVVSWSQFYAKGSALEYDLNQLPANWAGWTGGGCSGVISGTEYTRCATITSAVVLGVEQVTVVSEVSWDEANGRDRATQETVFTRY